ncbi:MAG: hypothetical protein AAF126_02595 [Chloroflexota bacterium]
MLMVHDETTSDLEDSDVSAEKKTIVEQTVQGYSREIELVRFVCRCPSCPYCGQEPSFEHINRKYCSEEAMLHHRHIQRKLAARKSGGNPGQVGRPRKTVARQVLYVLRAGETDFYKVTYAEDEQQFENDQAHEQETVSGGVELILKVNQPYCKEAVAVIYEVYARYVVNEQWIELSDTQLDELRELLA